MTSIHRGLFGGSSVLSLALAYGNLEVAKFLRKIVSERLGKDAFQKLVNTPIRLEGTCLYKAAYNDQPEFVQLLMSWDECDHTIAIVRVGEGYRIGYTPLHIAAEMGHLEVVKHLLEASRFSNSNGKKMEYGRNFF